jgi:glycosyltransferase involved in cell wall biosynthesis
MISIIVPVYNRINKLQLAVNSLLQQTYRDLEIILIDDGSTDGSSEICDELSVKDKRIHVIHQSNQGVSAARNAGLKQAKGEYIGFVDSDDVVEPTMYEIMLQTMQNYSVDLVVCGVTNKHFNKHDKLARIQKISHKNEVIRRKEEIVSEVLKLLRSALMHSVWNKLYRTDILIGERIAFPCGIPFGEDLLFNIEYLKNTTSIGFLSDCLYIYFSDEKTGTINRYFEGKHELMTKLYTGLFDYIGSIAPPTTIQYQQISFLYIKWTYSCFIDLFHKNCPLDKMERKRYIQNIVQREEVMEAARSASNLKGVDGILA